MAIPTSGTYKLYFSEIPAFSVGGPGYPTGSQQAWTTLAFTNNNGTGSVKFGKGYLLIPASGIYPERRITYDTIYGCSTSNGSFILRDSNGVNWYFSTKAPASMNDRYITRGNNNGYTDDSPWNVGFNGDQYSKATSSSGFNPGAPVCYLRDTHIGTPSGHSLVQDIRPGDEILSLENGKIVTTQVVWVGKATYVADPLLPDDLSGYPVRIRADAVGPGVPNKDMLITSEHSLFFDGKFIPVRMLVNSGSISYDKSFHSYDYYHIETASHAVILADCVWSESYLNTGNQERFGKNAASARRRAVPQKCWNENSAVPLCVDREFVEPIFTELNNRSQKLGFSSSASAPSITGDAALHLETEDGTKIWPATTRGAIVTFQIPERQSRLYIVSRYSRPCESIGPYVDDRRQLGVLVGTMMLDVNTRAFFLDAHLSKDRLGGWHPRESKGRRWTRGYAVLDLPPETCHQPSRLIMNILAGGPYPDLKIWERKVQGCPSMASCS